MTAPQLPEARLREIERVRTSITHHSVGVAHLLMAYDEACKEREEYRAVVARQIEDKRRLLAERNEARAVCSLVAGNLAAWADKREEAPESAQEHLDEAMHALVRFRPDGGYGEAASKLRLEMWHGEVYAERDAARAEAIDHSAALHAISAALGNPALYACAGETLSMALAKHVVQRIDEARAKVEQVLRDGQEMTAGLHEKLHEMRAEVERAAKQRDELVKAATDFRDLVYLKDGRHTEDVLNAVLAKIAAEQPKPVAWPHLPEVDRPASDVQP